MRNAHHQRIRLVRKLEDNAGVDSLTARRPKLKGTGIHDTHGRSIGATKRIGTTDIVEEIILEFARSLLSGIFFELIVIVATKDLGCKVEARQAQVNFQRHNIIVIRNQEITDDCIVKTIGEVFLAVRIRHLNGSLQSCRTGTLEKTHGLRKRCLGRKVLRTRRTRQSRTEQSVDAAQWNRMTRLSRRWSTVIVRKVQRACRHVRLMNKPIDCLHSVACQQLVLRIGTLNCDFVQVVVCTGRFVAPKGCPLVRSTQLGLRLGSLSRCQESASGRRKSILRLLDKLETLVIKRRAGLSAGALNRKVGPFAVRLNCRVPLGLDVLGQIERTDGRNPGVNLALGRLRQCTGRHPSNVLGTSCEEKARRSHFRQSGCMIVAKANIDSRIGFFSKASLQGFPSAHNHTIRRRIRLLDGFGDPKRQRLG